MNAPSPRELPAPLLDAAAALDQVGQAWDGDILRQLTDYIAIPAKSPAFAWKDALVRAADAALYVAKHDGRDCVKTLPLAV